MFDTFSNSIILTQYNSKDYSRKNISDLEEFFQKSDYDINWLSIIGLDNEKLLEDLANGLGLHPLVKEDILNTTESPKLLDYDDYLFLVIKKMFYNEEDELDTEQISFLLYKERLVSFEERESKIFNSALTRLVEGTNIRKNGTDDLLYALIDSVVDDYYLVIEELGKKIDVVEDKLLANPKKELLEEIYILKKDLIFIRNTLWPMRNVISSLSKNDYELIDGKTIYYLRDVYDNTIQMIDIVETYRDICSGMLDTYLSSIGNKTNEVMKVLTIFSTIFIPLTFLAGVYGMNFKYLPELGWKYGYLSFWMISLVMIAIMIRFFRKKDWM